MKKTYNTSIQKAMGKPTTVDIMTWKRGEVVVECVKAQAVCVSGLIWYKSNDNSVKIVQEFVQNIIDHWRKKCLLMDIDIPTGYDTKQTRYMSWQLWYKIEKPVTQRSGFVQYLDEYFKIGDDFLAYFKALADKMGFNLAECPKHHKA